MDVRVDFDIHGATPTVHRADRTVWLRIPLSESGQPALAVFLTSEVAERLLESLRVAVEGRRRLVALEAEEVTQSPAIIHHLDGNPSNHDMDNLLIVKKEENRRE